MIEMIQWVLFGGAAIAFWGFVLWLFYRLVRAVEARNARGNEIDALRARVGEIEQQLAVSRAELERLGAAESHAAMILARLTDSERAAR